MRKTTLESLGFAAAAAGISLIFAVVSIRIWDASLDIPFEYYWDSLFGAALFKQAVTGGSLLFNHDLGAPLGQNSIDFYQGGLTTTLFATFLGLFTDNWPLALNLTWLLGFVLVGVTAWWALYSLGIPRLAALVAAVLFAILPYHFWRGEASIFLSGYFVVPLAGYLILRVLRGEPLFPGSGRSGGNGRRQARWIVALVVLFCLLIGLGSIYYAIFTILILGIASILTLLVVNRRWAGTSGLVACGLIALVTLGTLAPALIFRSENGTNLEVTERTARESDFYGLSLSQMVMPTSNHRLQELSDAKQRFLSETITPSEDSQSLGLLGTVGLVACLLSLLVLPIGRPRWVEPVFSVSGVAILIAFLLGTIGGTAIIIATFISPELRAWNRLSVFIGFFALVGLAALLARVFSFLDSRTGKKAPSLLLGGLLLLFGLWDQTPARWPEQFQHDLIAEEFESDRVLVEKVEKSLPTNALIFQIPYLEYPEGFPPPGRMDDYDALRGYLHSDDLRWSYGAIKGRRADISFCVRDLPIPQLVQVIQAWGFSALWMDLDGYSRGSARDQAHIARMVTQSPPLRDSSGRFLVFPLGQRTFSPRVERTLREALPKDGAALQDCGPIARAIREADL